MASGNRQTSAANGATVKPEEPTGAAAPVAQGGDSGFPPFAQQRRNVALQIIIDHLALNKTITPEGLSKWVAVPQAEFDLLSLKAAKMSQRPLERAASDEHLKHYVGYERPKELRAE